MPLISVVSYAYNVSKSFSFDKSMRSILDQSISDFEFIICEDGSSDTTWGLLCEYANKDPRIVLIRNDEHLGLAASLNKCLNSANGKYIARHDLIDTSHRVRLEMQYNCLEANGDISFLGTQAYLYDKNGGWGREIVPAWPEKEDFLFCSPYIHGSVMFRRDDILEIGGYRVAKDTQGAEGYDLFMAMSTRFAGANMAECLYYYYQDKQTQEGRVVCRPRDEMHVRSRGFKALGIKKSFFHSLKPLFGSTKPMKLHKAKVKKKRREIL